jgi:hypothetical protein
LSSYLVFFIDKQIHTIDSPFRFITISNNVPDLIPFPLQMNGVPPVDFEPALELFRSVKCPQSIDSNDENGGYWDNIFSLIMEGRLVDVWQLVSLHGDVAAVIGHDEVINSNVKGLESDKRLVQAITHTSLRPYHRTRRRRIATHNNPIRI